jgi:hypothetical protein
MENGNVVHVGLFPLYITGTTARAGILTGPPTRCIVAESAGRDQGINSTSTSDRRASKAVTTSWRLFIDIHVNPMVACDFS